MSGICGAWAFEGQAPDLAPVLAALERRGPDATRQWRDGPIALGHTLLATTPEALVEKLPLEDRDSGCVITADVRLDNREELIGALELGDERRTIGDGELILRAYLKWDEQCPARLLGDFAFAIWDPRVPRLFCARDHMGMRQFNYCYLPDRLFAFSTVDTSLLALAGVPGTISEPKIADLIADLEGVDVTSTFFEQVHRLEPAHSMTVTGSVVKRCRYWTLRPGPRLNLPTDQAYADAFLRVLTEAVRCRLRAPGQVGAMLSGGLDSTAIVAVAGALLAEMGLGPLRTISAINPDAEQCAETRAIRSALTINGLDPILVSLSDLDGIRDILLDELKEARNPFEIHMTMLRSIYLAARNHGLNVVLDGGAGDVVLTSGNRIAEMVRQGSVRAAWQEAAAAQEFWQVPPSLLDRARQLLAGAWVAFMPIAVRAAWRRRRLSGRLPHARPGFARRVGFRDRRLNADGHLGVHIRDPAERRARSILHPNLTSGRERYDQVAGSMGVEARDPFMDLRVIDFCLSLPSEQLHDRGWPKIVVRRALAKMVPHDIAWRRGKDHLGSGFTAALLDSWPNWSDSMNDPKSPLAGYLNDEIRAEFRRAGAETPSGLKLRAFALDRFLRRYGAGTHGH
jgi:asparagine synthase (glutamine-hydrolysing)